MPDDQEQLVVAVDFDHTYDADHGLFRSFMKLLEDRGHQPLLVTKRADRGRWRTEVEEVVPDDVPLIFCGKSYKSDVVEEEGWEVDVWVDDSPEFIRSKSDLKDRLAEIKNQRHHYHKKLELVDRSLDKLDEYFDHPTISLLTSVLKKLIRDDPIEIS